MGYVTQCRGVIEIVPPIPWGQIRESPFLSDQLLDALEHPSASGPRRDVEFVIVGTTTDTDSGVVIDRVARGVRQRYDSEPRNYTIVEHLQELIDAYPGHEFVGRLDCTGEEPGDLWRLVVRNRTAFQVRPKLVWPDDDPAYATQGAAG